MNRKTMIYAAAVLSFLFPQYGHSENDSADGIVFTLGGNGMLYSIGYERIIGDFALSAGGSFFSASERGTGKNLQLYTVPVTANYLFDVSDGCHYLEAGLGITPAVLSSTMNSYGRETDLYVNPVISVGYRYQTEGWFLEFKLTPFYGTRPLNDMREKQNSFSLTGKGFQFWGGISFGFRL